ncbi:MAG TPA: hypothetical protein VFW80_12695 [Gaiellaceae bacterium]|nr:hypothetical protein [Gaiellaceae bacterium]
MFADINPILRGIVTENLRPTLFVEAEEVTERPGEIKRTESREIATYAVAVSPWSALDFLDSVIGVTGLSAVEGFSAPQ